MKEKDISDWDKEIGSSSNLLKLGTRDIWEYRDLLMLLVKRNIVAFYKQTVLGPLWYFIQPIFTMSVYVFIFGRLAGLSTSGLPQPLFYLTGITFWTYFSSTLTKTATSLKDNEAVLGKVYFPRVIIPMSIVLSNLFRLAIQLLLLFIVTIYFIWDGFGWNPSIYLAVLPIILLCLAFQSLGFGMIVSALTTKYRDLALLLTFGIQLVMYATPVVYPLESATGLFRKIIMLNPISFLFEGLRKSLYNVGTFDFSHLITSLFVTLLILTAGLLIFNKIEKDFVDTI